MDLIASVIGSQALTPVALAALTQGGRIRPYLVRLKQVDGGGRDVTVGLRSIAPDSTWVGAEASWYYPYTAGVLQAVADIAGRLNARLLMDAPLRERIKQVQAETVREGEVRKLMQRYMDDRKLPLAPYTTSKIPPPYFFQSISWHWAMRVDILYLQHKPGLGKTRQGTDIIRGKIDYGKVSEPVNVWLEERPARSDPTKILPARWGIKGGVLIVCPRVVVGEWIEQLYRWQGMRAIPIIGDAARKRKRAGIRAWVHLVTYESLESVEDNEYDFVIADEAHSLADEDSVRSKRMMALGMTASSRLALSGTPLSNMVGSLWAQYMWLDHGRTLGPTAEYYSRYILRAPAKGSRFEKKEDDTESAEDRVARAISRITYPLTMTEAFPDKAQKIHQVMRIPMTKEQSQYYHQLRKATEAEVLGGTISMTQEMTRLEKLLQVTQGFVYDSNKHAQQFSSAKLVALEEMLTGKGDFAALRVVVWVNHAHDIDRVAAMLAKHKIKHQILRGGMSDKELADFKYIWANDHTQQVCVGIISMGIGVNMHAPTCVDDKGKPARCFTTVFFGFSWKVTHLEQAMDRVYRSDQVETCLFRYLLSDDLDETEDGEPMKTIDVKIYDRLQMKLAQGGRVDDTSREYVRGLLAG